MMLYLLKSGICLLLAAGAYAIFLENETMHRFKRVYLMASLLLAFVLPLISVEIPADTVAFVPMSAMPMMERDFSVEKAGAIASDSSNELPTSVLWGLYLTVTGLLLMRFVRNVAALVRSARRQTQVRLPDQTFVLIDKKTLPYTFLNWIFVNRDDYVSGRIAPELITHERAHVRQKHSLDVIGIELLISFCWFNPVLFWYRRAIKQNHEFLADAFVNATYANITAYQKMLVNAASDSYNPLMVSALTFTKTKQRLIMMTKQTSPVKAGLLRIGALVPVLGMIGMAVGQPTVQPAMPRPAPVNPMAQQTVDDTTEAKQDTFYKKTKFLSKDRRGRIMSRQYAELTPSEKRSLPDLWQRKPLPLQQPTAAQMKAWTNSRQYGVWLDDKRIPNQVLNRYKPSQFASYFESKLEKNAKNYGKHYVQVGLMTPANYDKHVKDVQLPPLTIFFGS